MNNTKFIFFIAISSLLLSFTSSSAFAHNEFHGGERGYRGGYYRGDHDNFGHFLAPALIGGLIGYSLAQPHYAQQVMIYSPPAIYSAPPVYSVPPVYSAPNGFHYENISDANCNCYRTVLVSD